MTISINDFKFYYSGGQSNFNGYLSLGGPMSTHEMVKKNLFTDIDYQESVNGRIDYRCIYLVNNSDTEYLGNSSIQIEPLNSNLSSVSIGANYSNDKQILSIGDFLYFVTYENDFLVTHLNEYILLQSYPTSGTLKIKFENHITNSINWNNNYLIFSQNIKDALLDLGLFESVSVKRNNYNQYEIILGENTQYSLLEIYENNLSPVCDLIIEKDQHGQPKNSTAQKIITSTSSPSNVQFSDSLFLGNISPKDKFPIWLKREVLSPVSEDTTDGFNFKILGLLPTPTPTPTPTITPTSTPVSFTPTPTLTSTPMPTSTPTITPTPCAEYWVAREAVRSWSSIANSDDGVNVVAVAYGDQIFTSTDSGITWTARETVRNWRSVCSSSDGSKIAAVSYAGQIYTSTDSGINWTARESNRTWIDISCSNDGTKLTAVVFGGQIYTSTDGGLNWTARESNRNWRAVSSSGDGTKLAAVVYGGKIYTSTNSGINWTPRITTNKNWLDISISDDGNKLAAVVANGRIYVSINGGTQWAVKEQVRNWKSIDISGNQDKIISAVYGGKIYISSDMGETWKEVENNRNWNEVTSSTDGNKLFAIDFNGNIYTSSCP